MKRLPRGCEAAYSADMKVIVQSANLHEVHHDALIAIDRVFHQLLKEFVNNPSMLPKPKQDIEQEYKFRKLLEAKSRITIKASVALAYVEIQGYLPLSGAYADAVNPSKVKNPLDSLELRKIWSKTISDRLSELYSNKEFSYHYTTDSWIIVRENPEMLLHTLWDLTEFAAKYGIYLKSVATWGNPEIEKAIPYGDPYVQAYQICEESGMVKGRQVIVTADLRNELDKMKSIDLLKSLTLLGLAKIRVAKDPITIFEYSET
jgi:hypothetical protein